MLLHPGVIGLMVGSSVTLIMLLYAVATAIVIVRQWDFASSSAHQLQLERRTYLVSTIVQFGLILQVGSLFLFIFTAEEIHPLFVGAMCATGSLNANPVGWLVLLSKIVTFFLACFWISLNRLDQSAENMPLVKRKYVLLTGLLPFVILDFYLQLAYFAGLDPDIITSCCGSLFSDDDSATIASLVTLPHVPAMLMFVVSFVLVAFGMFFAMFRKTLLSISFAGIMAALFFPISIIAVISFISPYIYELPTHHCPFDVLQQEYAFVGYPLYITLFSGVFFCSLPAIFHSLRKIKELDDILIRKETAWMRLGFGGIISFMAMVLWAILSSNLHYYS